jgi:CBS domain-containing protein
MRRISVGDIMTRNPISVKPGASLYECAKTMAKERINSILIVEGKILKGILTARDILWAVTKKPGLNLKKVKAMSIATRKLAVIKPSADIYQALKKMHDVNLRRLPVLSKGELIGVITSKDIIAVEPELYAETRGLMDEIKEIERKISETKAEWPLEGLCDNCGAFSELLKVEGTLLCPDCRDEIY